MLDGIALGLPPELEQHARSLAEASKAIGADAAAHVISSPEEQIASYFARVHQRSYLDGFFRALHYFRVHRKEGRIKRLRELWNQLGRLHTASWPSAVYDEFDKLLSIGEADASSSAHDDPSVQARNAPVP